MRSIAFWIITVLTWPVFAAPDADLLKAVENGDLSEVKKALAAGANVDVRNPKGFTPLGLAAFKGNILIVKALIAAKADLNIQMGKVQNSALMVAALEGHSEVVRVIVEAKANIHLKNRSGDNALWHASMSGKRTEAEKIIEILEAAGLR